MKDQNVKIGFFYVGINQYIVNPIIIQLLQVSDNSSILLVTYIESLSILDQVFPRLIYVLTEFEANNVYTFC